MRCSPITKIGLSSYHSRQQEELNRYLFGFLKEKGAEDTLNLLYYSIKQNKRYPSSLCFLVSDLFQGDRQQALRYASLIEIIQTAVLVHDDVVDNEQVRDGMSSLWSFVKKEVAGNSQKFNPKNLALLLADGLLAKSLSLVEEPEVLQKVTEFLNKMTDGAISEHKGEHLPPLKTERKVEDYLQTVKMKKGSLFALAAQLGYFAGGKSNRKDETEQLMASIGYDLGLIQHLAQNLAKEEEKLPITDRRREELLVTSTKRFLKKVRGLPDNHYRQLLTDMPFFLANRLLAKSDKRFRLELK